MPKPSNKGPKTTVSAVTAIEGSPGSDVITPYEELNSSSAATTENADTVNGNDGDDWIEGGLGDDIIFGGLGDDFLFGDEGQDTIHGGDGNDWIAGGAGDDTLFGDAGNDVFIGGMGNDSIDGGDGTNTVYYYGVNGDDFTDPLTDYTMNITQETVGKGKNKSTVDVIYVTAADGTVDRIVNATIEFLVPEIQTGIDAADLDLYTETTSSINVLANDYLLKSYELPDYSSDLTLNGITDIFIDTDGDWVNDIVFDAEADYYSAPFELSDGSFVQLEADGTLTFTLSDTVEYGTEDTIIIEYEVSAPEVVSAEGDGVIPTSGFAVIALTSSETIPEPVGTLTLESMTFDTIGAYDTYLDGSFAVTQLTTVEFVIEGYDPILIGVSELRDISAPLTESGDPDYDYDSSLLLGGDNDEEWRVWTEDGTPHEMNVTTIANIEALSAFGQDPADVIVLESFKLTGFDEGEGLTVQYWNANGTEMLGFDYIDDLADLEGDGVTYLSNYDYEKEPSVFQVTFSADDGTDVYIDDIVFV